MWFDTHAHITSLDDSLIPALLQRALEKGVRPIVNICTKAQELKRGLELKSATEGLYNAAATTPHDVQVYGEEEFSYFEQAAQQKQLCAIGETGLDYYYEHSAKKLQQEFFLRYMDLAVRSQLPLVIHCRNAFEDLLHLLDKNYLNTKQPKPFILHCFTGTKSQAKELIDRGGFISFSGIVTFKKSHDLREIARYVPLDLLLIETDTPYLAPESKRGKPNEPAFLPEVGLCLAAVKNISQQELAKATWHNAMRVFGLA